ncbi:hypothetical protein D778_02391 [Xanthomarina gelatinilytica]|uniref:Restriction endonuclease n=1 Tax=Xanthomarina gelatinilytica TaxID=1137281 RepID=M7MH26_9FLAO|nr:hypothetical protein [Xanthomarina gelatinilytica]EMQ95557.1 hypothetical protein D778_02391 [Xanthomarina gelatinilytica]
MQKFYETFHELVKKRVEKYNAFNVFGEDSIRYDFAFTAVNTYNLTSIDVILEQPMPKTQFINQIQINNQGQGRKNKKPEFDLRIDPKNKLKQGIIAEFAYFRRTAISKNQARPKNHGKILNDMFRLALLKHYTNEENDTLYSDFSKYKCLLVCVTDDEMIDYGIGGRNNTVPIQVDYPSIDSAFLNTLTITSNKQIQPMFKDKLTDLNLIVNAKRVFCKEEASTINLPKWVTWIWEVDYSIIK